MQTLPWLTILIVVPLVAAVVLWLVVPLRAWARPIGLTVSLAVLVASVVMATGFDVADAGAQQFTEVHPWIPTLGVTYALGVNGLGLVMVLLSAFLVPVVLLSSWRDPDGGVGPREEAPAVQLRRQAGYVALILALEAMMIAVFAARDLFLFYVLFEAMLVPVYFLIGAYGGPRRRYAAVKFLLYSLVGGLVMLAAVVALYVQGPGGPEGFLIDNLTGLDLATGVERWLFLGFFLAFAIKAPMFPVHTWLPDAAQQATPGTSTLLVGVLDKVGTFGMIALCLPLFPDASRWAAPVIVVLALVSIIYGGLLAIGQNDLMRLVAYTSVSHFGFIVLGIFVFTSTATTGSALYMLAHGLSTAALFLIGGMLTTRGGSQDIGAYGGMQRVTPILAGAFLVAGLASVALPGLSGFVPEFLVLVGSYARSVPAGVVATTGVIIAALYILLAYQRLFTGPVQDRLSSIPDLRARERWVVAPLVAAMLALGVYPAPALDVLTPVAEETVASVGVEDPTAQGSDTQDPAAEESAAALAPSAVVVPGGLAGDVPTSPDALAGADEGSAR
jgi:NADH-quinone oxidoreductase subunit M